MSVHLMCPGCGYTGQYKTQALADVHFHRHSCQAQRCQQEDNQRRSARVAQRPIRDCAHTKVHHEHGTRNAYVFDHCRCAPCTAANTAAHQARARSIAYGRWQPYVDADAARAHLQHLARAGIGLKRAAALSGISYGSLSRLAYGEPATGRGPTRRIRPQTEQRILAVTANPGNRADRALVDATGTQRRIQALVTNGWAQEQLARRIGRQGRSFRRLLTQATVTAATARAVSAIYEQLWDVPPPTHTATENRAATKARAYATQLGWAPPMAWDDIDTDAEPPEPPPASAQNVTTSTHACGPHQRAIDEVAIQRAMDGDSGPLTPEERDEVVRRLTAQGVSIRKIAERIHASKRTVERRRRAATTAA